MSNEAIPPSNPNHQTEPLQRESKIERERERVKKEPGENGSAIALILSIAADFGVRFPIRLNGVFLGAFVAFPLLLTVLPAEVLLDPRQVPQGSRRVVVHARWFGTHVHSLPYLLGGPLPQLPRQVVTSPMKLQILVPLKSFVAYLAHEPVRRQQRLRRQSNHLCLRI